MKTIAAILVPLILTSCVTTSLAHNPQEPSLSWDAACQPENLQGMTSWILLTCTMTNRSEETLNFQAIEHIQTDKDAWRQPDADELAILKRDLERRTPSRNLPLMLNGGDRLEGFVAQMLVVSGLWLTQSLKDPVQLPEKTEKSVDVKAGGHVRQAFVLYKESMESPAYAILSSADGGFRKRVDFLPVARQRVTTP
ncbi:MAG TPA: hypothetical protein VFO10_22995 [Oligoflexus sp.]|uniref:hypothetical protein n=1 Tax=Oligoflexus sp. TaxID=1971216 RepID=UPI002D7EC753|nr:hypothetical protein [Oligoflexus sp.]HET9240149.1 hypothetical protein [Oligoflexus sp.]